MDAEKTFWEGMKEFGSLDYIDFTWQHKDYQVVGDHGDGVCFICTYDAKGETITLGEFTSIDDLLDKSNLEGKTFREIMHSPDLEYFCFH